MSMSTRSTRGLQHPPPATHGPPAISPRPQRPPQRVQPGSANASPGGYDSSRSRDDPSSPSAELRWSPRPVASPRLGISRRATARASSSRQELLSSAQMPLNLPPCIWCWHESPDHQPKKCPERAKPDMKDFKQARAVQTRQRVVATPAATVANRR